MYKNDYSYCFQWHLNIRIDRENVEAQLLFSEVVYSTVNIHEIAKTKAFCVISQLRQRCLRKR